MKKIFALCLLALVVVGAGARTAIDSLNKLHNLDYEEEFVYTGEAAVIVAGGGALVLCEWDTNYSFTITSANSPELQLGDVVTGFEGKVYPEGTAGNFGSSIVDGSTIVATDRNVKDWLFPEECSSFYQRPMPYGVYRNVYITDQHPDYPGEHMAFMGASVANVSSYAEPGFYEYIYGYPMAFDASPLPFLEIFGHGLVIPAGLDAIGLDIPTPAQYYDLTGRPVAEPTATGLYIQRQGSMVTKTWIR